MHVNISQGSEATHLRCGHIFNNDFIANLVVNLSVEELNKSVKHLVKLRTNILFHCPGILLIV